MENKVPLSFSDLLGAVAPDIGLLALGHCDWFYVRVIGFGSPTKSVDETQTKLFEFQRYIGIYIGPSLFDDLVFWFNEGHPPVN